MWISERVCVYVRRVVSRRVVKGARENLGHGVPADQDFPMQAGVAACTAWSAGRSVRMMSEARWAKPGGGRPRPGGSPAPPGRVTTS